LYEPVVLIVF